MMYKRSLVLPAVLAIALLASALAGCLGNNDTAGTGGAKADEIDRALHNGPVLVDFGAEWCGWCEVQAPVIESVLRDAKGVTLVSVDVDANSSLADEYYVQSVPQMNLIVKKNADGSYLYVDPQGNTTTDRFRSRIIGYREYDELRPLVDAALEAR